MTEVKSLISQNLLEGGPMAVLGNGIAFGSDIAACRGRKLRFAFQLADP
jgi:hypothetical protein